MHLIMAVSVYLLSTTSKLHYKGLERECSVLKYVKGVPFNNKRYIKGVQNVYKRVRGWTLGQSLPVLNFVKYPPPGVLTLLPAGKQENSFGVEKGCTNFKSTTLGGHVNSREHQMLWQGLDCAKHSLQCVTRLLVQFNTKQVSVWLINANFQTVKVKLIYIYLIYIFVRLKQPQHCFKSVLLFLGQKNRKKTV